MKIQLLSDLHLEFYRGDLWPVKDSLVESDVLVIAGDLTSAEHLKRNILAISEMVSHLVYVPGNHEYYKSNFDYVELTLAELSSAVPNFHWLNNSFVEINGKRFIGGTLWFEGTDEAKDPQRKCFINDFRLIRDCDPLAFIKYEGTRRYLLQNVKENDIVVTHHLPSPKSTPRQFRGSSLNHYFASNQEEIMRNNKPQLWLHGHTHTACHYWVGNTQVYCNPYGYPNEGKRTTNFKKELIINAK